MLDYLSVLRLLQGSLFSRIPFELNPLFPGLLKQVLGCFCQLTLDAEPKQLSCCFTDLAKKGMLSVIAAISYGVWGLRSVLLHLPTSLIIAAANQKKPIFFLNFSGRKYSAGRAR